MISFSLTPVVLASGSPTRARLLKAVGLSFIVDPPRVDEDEVKAAFRAEGAAAEDLVEALAELKARRISPAHPGALVIGADQVLVLNGRWFDKPETRDKARTQLQALRGQTHQLVTCALTVKDGQRLWHQVTCAHLTMRPFSDEFLDDYLTTAGAEVLSCVGAYQLEGLGAQLFSKVEGDYFSILGLPLLPLMDVLRNHGALRS